MITGCSVLGRYQLLSTFMGKLSDGANHFIVGSTNEDLRCQTNILAFNGSKKISEQFELKIWGPKVLQKFKGNMLFDTMTSPWQKLHQCLFEEGVIRCVMASHPNKCEDFNV